MAELWKVLPAACLLCLLLPGCVSRSYRSPSPRVHIAEHNETARRLFDEARYQEALEEQLKAAALIEANPQEAGANNSYSQLAKIYYALNRLEEAERAVRAALAIKNDPSCETFQCSTDGDLLIKIKRARGEWEEVRDIAARRIRAYAALPRSRNSYWRYYVQIARAFYELGDYDNAVEAATVEESGLAAAVPEYLAQILLIRGHSAAALGDRRKASSYYRQARREAARTLSPEMEEIYSDLSKAAEHHEAQGESADAKKVRELAAMLGGSSPSERRLALSIERDQLTINIFKNGIASIQGELGANTPHQAEMVRKLLQEYDLLISKLHRSGRSAQATELEKERDTYRSLLNRVQR